MPTITKEEASAAARALRAIETEARRQASRENGKRGGRPRGSAKPLAEIECTCGAFADDAHKTTCPRGRAFRRRQKQDQAASTREEVKA